MEKLLDGTLSIDPAVAGVICPLCRRVKENLGGSIMIAIEGFLSSMGPFKICDNCCLNLKAKIQGSYDGY